MFSHSCSEDGWTLGWSIPRVTPGQSWSDPHSPGRKNPVSQSSRDSQCHPFHFPGHGSPHKPAQPRLCRIHTDFLLPKLSVLIHHHREKDVQKYPPSTSRLFYLGYMPAPAEQLEHPQLREHEEEGDEKPLEIPTVLSSKSKISPYCILICFMHKSPSEIPPQS